MPIERTIADAFELGSTVLNVQPLGHGLINDTYLVTTVAGHHAVLQRVNQRAFPQPELIMQNMRILADYLGARGGSARNGFSIPSVFKARDGQDFIWDENQGFWRVLSFIEDAITRETIQNVEQAGEVGTALGRFHAMVSGLDSSRMRATRPGFHQTPLYYERFLEATRQANIVDSDDVRWCLEFARERRDFVDVLEAAKQRGELPLRVIHGDPKLDNFLFNAGGDRIISLIDLDTVQPGLVHYDIGDCLRSCANPAGESPRNVDDVRFDLDIFKAMLKHYLAQTREFLTATEVALLYDAIHLIPFELGLRFLTDHLKGDVYFKTKWRGHNLHRAICQFRLTAEIERKEPSIRTAIAAFTT